MTDLSDTTERAAIDREFLKPSKRRPHYLERISIFKALQEVRHQVKSGIILDVGCGMKPYESILNASGSAYYGTDYPITMKGSYGESTKADFFSVAASFTIAKLELASPTVITPTIDIMR